MEPSEVVIVAEMENDVLLTRKELITKTLKILIPTDISNFLWMLSQTVTMMFVGHYLGKVGTAQYSAGILIFNLFGHSIVTGFGSAIDTISSQVYGRDPTSPEVGETLQRALALEFFIGIFMSIFFLTCTPLLIIIFGEEVGRGAGIFLANCPIYLAVQIITGAMSKTMFAQHQPINVAIANLVAAITSPIANLLFTHRGIHGAAHALALNVGLCAVVHILFCLYHPAVVVRLAPWPSPRLLEKKSWLAFLKVGFPSLVAVCAEWWAFEVQAFFAVCISPLALAVHGIAMNLISLLFSIALGVSISASVVVGNAMGAMKPRQAQQYAQFIIICDIIIGALTAAVMLLFGRNIARMYSTDEEVILYVTEIMPFIVFTHVGDSLQFCLQGIYRGVGKQKVGAIAVIGTLWAIGIPASFFNVFLLKLGVDGILSGLLFAFCFEIPLLYYLMNRFNWEKLARRAQHVTTAVHDEEEEEEEDLNEVMIFDNKHTEEFLIEGKSFTGSAEEEDDSSSEKSSGWHRTTLHAKNVLGPLTEDPRVVEEDCISLNVCVGK